MDLLGVMKGTMENIDKKKVLVINTGGTASMKRGEDGRLDTVPGYLSERIAGLEELAEPGMPEVSIKEYVPLIDSSHMEPATWLKLAKDIEANYYEYDGFVVVMGTDTMAYAASAVSFLLENLGKTVIFTGSQIPLSQPYTDCRRNVLVSIILAGNGHFPEVCLFFSDRLLRACRATKVNSFGLDAFVSPNCNPLMTLATGMRNSEHGLPQPRSRFRVHDELATGVVAVKLIPGYDDLALLSIVNTAEESNLKAIVLEVYGSGGAPYQKPGLRKLVEMANEHGILVVAKSQCLIGSVLPDMYAANVSNGVASAGDMTAEALVTKLAYLFAKLKNYDRETACKKVKELLLTSLRGEVSPPETYTQQLLAREPISTLAKL
eukprot:TRINITY_DN18238_c0_g1_i2.p1 TRINITY_DN18238_c0_g1~~TRINITY_DN18238_c0_g1_i2.p1  ORF type:complete len:378 (+),score=133.07 TRINITY_DN18238_c0_g1_i2:47-1180(+)